MVEVTSVAAAVGVIKSAVEGLKHLKQQGLTNKHASEVDSAMDQLRDAQDRVLAIHEELLRLREENHDLRRQLKEQDDWKEQAAQYELVRTRGGA